MIRTLIPQIGPNIRHLLYKRSRLHHEHLAIQALHHEASLLKKALEQELFGIMPCLSDRQVPHLSSLFVLDAIEWQKKTVGGIIIQIPTSIQLKAVSLPKLFTPVWLVRAQPMLETYARLSIQAALLDRAALALEKERDKTAAKLRLLLCQRLSHQTHVAAYSQRREWL